MAVISSVRLQCFSRMMTCCLGPGTRDRANVEVIRAVMEISSANLWMWNLSTIAPHTGVARKLTNGFSPMITPTWEGVNISCLKYNAIYGRSDPQAEKKQK